MNKIREEFEKPENWDNWPTFWKDCYIDGRISRDGEINKLEIQVKHLTESLNESYKHYR